MFKIRRKTDGLFSTGGSLPGFHKVGKTWDKLQHISSHFTNLDTRHNNPYKNCEIVEYEMNEIGWIEIDEFIKLKEKRKKERMNKELLIENQRAVEILERQIAEAKRRIHNIVSMQMPDSV